MKMGRGKAIQDAAIEDDSDGRRKFLRYGLGGAATLAAVSVASSESASADVVAHHVTHASGGTDAVTATSIGAVAAGSLVINVKDYGATGDGTTDDSANIQAAIAASPVGAIVYFPPGTYVIGTLISLKAYRHYVGSNRWQTIIKQKNGANLVGLFVSEDWNTYSATPTAGQPIDIEEFWFDGNSTNNTASTHGLLLMNWGSRIEHCIAGNLGGDGVRLTTQNRVGVNISNNCIADQIADFHTYPPLGGSGIRIYDPSNNKLTDGTITGCLDLYGGDYGIFADASAGWLISGNHTYGQNKNGIETHYGFATEIVDNYVEQYGVAGSSSGFYTGINVSLIAGRSSVVANNRVWPPTPDLLGQIYGVSVTAQTSCAARVLIANNTYEGLGTLDEVAFVLSYQSGGTLAAKRNGNMIFGVGSGNDWAIQGAGVTLLDAILDENVQSTASYTLKTSDAGKMITTNTTSANSLIVPKDTNVPMAVGTIIEVYQYLSGQTTISPATDVFIFSAGGKLKLASQHSVARLRYRGSNYWTASGDLST